MQLFYHKYTILGLIFILKMHFSYAQKITFNNQVAPIIFKNCSSCHQDGESCLFSFMNYKEVASRAKMIKEVVNSGYMPPWKQDPEYRHFENERFLSTSEIKIINDWVDKGAIEGIEKIQYSVLKSSANLGNPDGQIKMKVPFPIKGINTDIFAWVKMPYSFESPLDSLEIEAIEFVAVNKKLMHHISYDVIGLDKESAFSRPYFMLENGPLGNRDPYTYLGIKDKHPAFINGWLPGMGTTIFNGEMGVKIPKTGVILLNMVHYAGTPINDMDSSYFNVYFKKQAIGRLVSYMALTSGAKNAVIEPPLIIPADSIKTYKSISVIQSDISLMYVSPHMHLLGKKYVAYVIDLTGDTIPLIRINTWDFNWQQVCKLNPMIHIKKGSQIIVEGTYDNTAQNPRNPFHPPQTIYSEKGMKTTDEMLGLGIHYVNYRKGDEKLQIK